MTERFHLDTHVVVWLAAGALDRFPTDLLRDLDTAVLVVSPIVRLELDLLHERHRISASASEVIDKVTVEVGIQEDATPLARVVMAAVSPRRTWHNGDPYDRLILAAAIADRARLVTKDGPLRAAFPEITRWD